jgi:hypothetical protein
MTGFRRNQQFIEEFGTDTRMTKIPAAWQRETAQFKPLCYNFQEAVLLSFLAYLRRGFNGNNPVDPRTAFVYLAGVKFMLTNLGVSTVHIDNSPIIKGVKTGMLNSVRMEE